MKELVTMLPCRGCGSPTTRNALCHECLSDAFEERSYKPSEATIRRLCLRFQRGWSEGERVKRRGGFVETVEAETRFIGLKEIFA